MSKLVADHLISVLRKIEDEMEKRSACQFTEQAHSDADYLLIRTINNLALATCNDDIQQSCERITDIFDSMQKWYS